MTQEEKDSYYVQMEKVQVGMIESDFSALWEEVKKDNRIGIIDVDQYESEGYISRSYKIGYFYYESYGDVAYPKEVVLAVVDCVNQKVSSIYYP
jgi:hypothetical protein